MKDSKISTPGQETKSNLAPIPSDWSHAKTLMTLSLKKDRAKPHLWALKILLQPLLLMLYTIGMFLGYRGNDGSSYIAGEYRLYNGETWTYPATIRMGAFNKSYLEKVADTLSQNSFNVEVMNESTSDEIMANCEGNIDNSASNEICVSISAVNEYTIYFGGKETAYPTQMALSGAQNAINSALLNVSGLDEIYPALTIQRTPEVVTKDTVKPVVSVLLVPAIMYVLAAVICSLFVGGAITNEKLNGIAKSYLLVGVKMRTYLLQWLGYCSLTGIVLAGLLTLVCVFFKLMPMSNGGLIFVSNYLGLVQLYAMLILLMQFVNSEETSSVVIWLIGFLSMGIGSAFLALDSAQNAALTVLTVVSPFIGMMQYFGIYITYDYTGFNTGIHPGLNVASSGLLGNMIAQICGILLWVALILVYSKLRNTFGRKSEQTVSSPDSDVSDKFEPLLPGQDVVLSVKGLYHSYYPSPLSCDKTKKPVDVLKGLNLDICRGEVFGYLGHNGCGKTSSVEVLSGELALQKGQVTYHFRDGDARFGDSSSAMIQPKIGVCPQHNDSLQAALTCRETLALFGMLKGGFVIKEGQTLDQALSEEVERRLSDVKFTSDEDADKPVGTFSGGMKRKLLIAVALLGDPEVVFMDEPSAGLDPYNRRIIWDMIIAAKKDRSIILTTHFLDEADILSDRIGILKNGKLVTCGSSLFLKHTLGAGYSLKYKSENPVNVQTLVTNARLGANEGDEQQWNLNFGVEEQIPDALLALSDNGATDISLELTTLEAVFLETGKEDFEEANEEDEVGRTNHDNIDTSANDDVEFGHDKEEQQARIWERRATILPITYMRKYRLVERFVRTNAFKMKGSLFLNIFMPMLYMIVGLVVVSLISIAPKGETIANPPYKVSTPWTAGAFFGVESLPNNSIYPLQPVPPPLDIADLFNGSLPTIGGHFNVNSTLSYSPNVDYFALQFGASVIANYSVWLGNNSILDDGITTSVQQLPYVTESPFRFDVLFLPMMLSFGFAGLAFTVLDVLLLKGNNIVELFRVGGITEWTTYLGVSGYKLYTTFIPFFTVAIILGLALKSVLFGNGGRWLGTILIMIGYAYSSTPIGLILAKRFVKGDYKEVANWFPGVYFTFVALPYIAWSSVLQVVPSAKDVILIIGDVLCIIPFFAFQRGLGGVILISTEFNDSNLSWRNVWQFGTRIWYTILVMIVVGSLEWFVLYRLTSAREPKTKLTIDESTEFGTPQYADHNPDIEEERDRSRINDEGINARDIVKAFIIEKKTKGGGGLGRRRKKERVIKPAVKGVSFGVRKNEIYALLGPNGAGKSTIMNILASHVTPEHGDIALGGIVCTDRDLDTDHLYCNGNVSFCPQFDALFPRKSVDEHLKFYAAIRGLDWDADATQNHVNAIIKLLGLQLHRTKEANELSGGYKRRLCLALAMLGYPKAMMLDECTTGIDPAARHLVWDVLKPSIRNGYDVAAILLSSHYMDECQQLGTRIGIMIDGELVTTGELSRLQELYCTGLFVEISLQPSVVDSANSELETIAAFAEIGMEASVYESLPLRFKLKVGFQQDSTNTDNKSIKQLAEAFRMLETKKVELGIQFYSIAPMSLEQIFIDLSRKQFETDEELSDRKQQLAQL